MNSWRKLALVGLSSACLVALPAATFAAPPADVPTTDPVNDFAALNLGLGPRELPSVAHFNISNITADSMGSTPADLILIPSSAISGLSAAEIAQLKGRLAAGAYVVAWSDGSTSSPSQLDSVLGDPYPSAVSAKDRQAAGAANPGTLFAAGLVMRNGTPISITFYSNGGVTDPINLLGIESIWAGLNTNKNHVLTIRGPQGNGADPCYDTGQQSYTDGTNGILYADDSLCMNRVNNNTLSEWTDHLNYWVDPGSALYSKGQTQFGWEIENGFFWPGANGAYPSQQLIAALPNTTISNTTYIIDLNGGSWSWTVPDLTVTNDSSPGQVIAEWELSFQSGSSVARTAYDGQPGWQMSNSVGPFVYTRTLAVQWHNYTFGYYTAQSTFSQFFSFPDW